MKFCILALNWNKKTNCHCSDFYRQVIFVWSDLSYHVCQLFRDLRHCVNYIMQ